MGILCAHLAKVRKWDGHAQGTADFHHSPAAEASKRGTGVGGRARGSGKRAYKALGPAGGTHLAGEKNIYRAIFRQFQVKSSQVKCIINSTEFGDIRYKINGYFEWGHHGTAQAPL